MSIELKERVAIITGAGAGLGRAHALALAAAGARVVVNDINSELAAGVAHEIRRAGGAAMAGPCSVTDFAAVQLLVEQTLCEFGRVDIVVNNAGVLRDKTFANMTLDDFRLVLDVHLMGSVHFTKAVWELMKQQQYGRIVYTTSSSGLWGNFGQSNYSAAKMALVGLMQTLGLEGERYNIRVNALAPSASTQMTAGVMSEELLEDLAPSYVSPAVVFLSSAVAPNRAIICAGAGTFARTFIAVTQGVHIGAPADASERLAEEFNTLSQRVDDRVLETGLQQSRYEVEQLRSAQGRR